MKEEEHTRRYGHNLDFPAYNFIEARTGAQLAANTMLSRNVALILTSAVVITILAGLFTQTGSKWNAGVPF